MPRKTLTHRLVEGATPPATGRTEIFDATLSGFCLRVTSSGKKSFAVMYRHNGKLRRLTVGRFPAMSLAKAREEAKAALQAVEEGRDPAGERQEAKAAPEPRRDTVEAVATDYVERHCKRNLRSWTETDRLLRKYLIPELGSRDVRELTRRDVRDLVDGVVDNGKPVQANRVLAAVHAMLTWAVDREILDVNPAAGVKKPTREKPRERVLSDGELVKVWKAAEGLGYPAGPYIKTLILTGARRDEAREMRWREVDLDKALWTIPGERAKNGEPHVVPLSEAMLDLLRDLPRFTGGDYVFTAGDGAKPYANVIKPKKRIERDSEVEGWTLHDLRRTAASGMGDLGIAGETIARVLNHAEGQIAGITARYNRADQTEAKRRALEAWAQHVCELAGAERADNVVSING
jgi:integrase